jgi:hypothetical protein
LFFIAKGYDIKRLVIHSDMALKNYNLVNLFKKPEELNEVLIYSGKTSKKNNPAIDLLKKIWEHRRKNGLRQFNQYEMEKYEKLEFDMNTIDSAFMKSKIFKGMEFVFKQVDTSKVTGKTYLPIFINEALSNVYGDNDKGEPNVYQAFRNSDNLEEREDQSYYEMKVLKSSQTSFEDRYKSTNASSPLKFSSFTKYHQLILDKILKQNKDINTYDRIEDFKNWFTNNFMEIIQSSEIQNQSNERINK